MRNVRIGSFETPRCAVPRRQTLGRANARAMPGAWRSVNDLRVQLGPELFDQFLDLTTERVAGMTSIETAYLTRAWAARRA